MTVRPARMDRQLRPGGVDARWSDETLDARVEEVADAAREKAHAEGYTAGWTQGRHAAAVQAATEAERARTAMLQQQTAETQRLAGLLAGLAQASLAAQERTSPEWAEVADVLAEGAIRLASAALGRELSSVDDAMMQQVRVALRQIADPAGAVVHLHPQDAQLVADPPDGVRIVPDPAVPAGGVVALTASQRLRIDLPSALAAAEDVLRS